MNPYMTSVILIKEEFLMTILANVFVYASVYLFMHSKRAAV